jgi:hypothetical protein
MKIQEGSSSIKLDIPEFKCDSCLGGHIEDPMPASHHFMVMAGAPGSGKSSLALGLLLTKGDSRVYRKVFHNVFVFMPLHSMHSLKKNTFENHDPTKTFHDIDMQSLEKVYAMVQGFAAEEKNSLIVIDDMTADLKNHDNLKFLMMLINNRRHLRLSLWFLVQSYISIPLSLRKVVSHLVMFKPSNKKEYLSLFEELLHLPRHVADAITQYVFKTKHDFLVVDIANGSLYRNFNKLSFLEE